MCNINASPVTMPSSPSVLEPINAVACGTSRMTKTRVNSSISRELRKAEMTSSTVTNGAQTMSRSLKLRECTVILAGVAVDRSIFNSKGLSCTTSKSMRVTNGSSVDRFWADARSVETKLWRSARNLSTSFSDGANPGESPIGDSENVHDSILHLYLHILGNGHVVCGANRD